MGQEFFRKVNNRSRAHDERADWFSAVAATVVECDPETLAVKVIIPVLDENDVYDEWVTPLVGWVGTDGYGPVNPPAIGSEVVLFSELNDGETLFYLSRYNEEYRVPGEFSDGARGLKTETAYRLLADLLIEIISQQRILIQAANQVDVKADQVNVEADQVEIQASLIRLLGGENDVLRGEAGKIGFLGAGAISRQVLPTPAFDLSSCITLTNALRARLIAFGLCE